MTDVRDVPETFTPFDEYAWNPAAVTSSVYAFPPPTLPAEIPLKKDCPHESAESVVSYAPRESRTDAFGIPPPAPSRTSTNREFAVAGETKSRVNCVEPGESDSGCELHADETEYAGAFRATV